MLGWLATLQGKRFRRDLHTVLSTLQKNGGSATTLELWDAFSPTAQAMHRNYFIRTKSLGWVHSFLDDLEELNYITSEYKPGTKARGYYRSRLIHITPYGSYYLERFA